jgi:hypothetical protein
MRSAATTSAGGNVFHSATDDSRSTYKSTAAALQNRRLVTTPTGPTPLTANSPQPSSLYSGPRPTNSKPHSDWTTKRVPLMPLTVQACKPSLVALAAAEVECYVGEHVFLTADQASAANFDEDVPCI